MSYNAQAQIMMAGWEMTLSMPSLTQTWKDPAAAMTTTTQRSEFWVATRQFLYFSFVKILVTHFCMTYDEFQTIAMLYVELCQNMQVFIIQCLLWRLLVRGGSQAAVKKELNSLINQRIYVPTSCLYSSVNQLIYGPHGHRGLASRPHRFIS
jgi:hypothetical protein